MNTKRAGRTTGRLALFFVLTVGLVRGAQPTGSTEFVACAQETRNRAAVLLIGEMFTAPVAQRLQERWADEASFYRPRAPVTDAPAARLAIDRWLGARAWHVVVLGLSPGAMPVETYGRTLEGIVRNQINIFISA